MTHSFIEAETLKEHVAALLKNAPKPGKNGLSKKISCKIIDAKLGFFGLFALLKFEEKARLGIFNIAQGKFQKILKLKSINFKYASGGSLLFIFYPDLKIVELWNLQTMKKIKVKKISIDDGLFTTFAMGAALKSKVLVSGVNLDERFYGILNLKTFKFTRFKNKSLFSGTSADDRIHLRCNNNMTKALSWSTSSSSDFNYVFLSNNPPTFKYDNSSYGDLNFANNDDLVLTTGGDVLNSDGVVLKEYPESMLFPVLGGDLYIQYKLDSEEGEPNIIIRDLNSHNQLSAFTTDLKLSQNPWVKTDFTSDRTLLASNISGRMLIIDNRNLKLKIYSLGISRTGNSFGSIPKAFVGKTWVCKLRYPKGTKVVVEDGPKNMTYNAVSNTLIWSKPMTEGTQDVLLSIKKPGEDEFYKEIKIIIKKK